MYQGEGAGMLLAGSQHISLGKQNFLCTHSGNRGKGVSHVQVTLTSPLLIAYRTVQMTSGGNTKWLPTDSFSLGSLQSCMDG